MKYGVWLSFVVGLPLSMEEFIQGQCFFHKVWPFIEYEGTRLV